MEFGIQKCFATTARVKTALLTFVFISALLLLLEAWREDLWTTFSDVELESTPLIKDGNSLEEAALPQHNTSEETAVPEKHESSLTTTLLTAISTTTAVSSATLLSTTSAAVALPTRPAIIAAGMRPSDLTWMNDMVEE